MADALDTIAALEKRNQELTRLLEQARDSLGEMRTKLAEASAPPQSFATFVQWAGKHADIVANGRRMRVAVLPSVGTDLKPGDEVLLNAMSVIVGTAEPERAGQAAIVREVIDDERVSRMHAVVRLLGTRAVIEDAGSTNGTYVDGVLVQGPTELREGASVRLGKRGPVFRYGRSFGRTTPRPAPEATAPTEPPSFGHS